MKQLLEVTRPPHVHSWYVETIVFGAILPGILLWLCRGTQLRPFVLPLLVLFPLWLALRYGFLPGMVAAGLSAGMIGLVFSLSPDWIGGYPRAQVIAMVLAAMCSGEVRDVWHARTRKLEHLTEYGKTRLQQLTDAYQVLAISHSQLERRLGGSAASLRTSLERLRHQEQRLDDQVADPLQAIAAALLDIMVDAGHLYTAGLHEVDAEGAMGTTPLAQVGTGAELSPTDPLLLEAMRTATLACAPMDLAPTERSTLGVVPLVDATGRIHAVLGISDMPFQCIRQETFDLLAVLARHMGDILARQTRSMATETGQHAFRSSLEKCLVHARKHGTPAAVIACHVVDVPRRGPLVDHWCRNGRGLDQSWISTNPKGEPVVVKILALADEVGVASYLARLARERIHDESGGQGTVTRVWMMDKSRTSDEIMRHIAGICDPATFESPPAKTRPILPRPEVAL